MRMRLDGRLILVVVLTSYCIFCVSVGLLFLGESERRSVCTTVHYCALNLLTVLWRDWTLCGTGAFAGSWGISRHGEKGKRELEPGPGVSGRREESRIGGFLWSPLSRSEERSGDQSGLFYVAGVRLWSLRVTYSTHFIKFTSVLIADQ